MIEEELPDELENDLDDIEPVGDESQLYEHFRVVVDKGQAMVRVDKYLFERIVNASRNRIQKAAEGGFVMANGKPVKSSYKVKPLDVITVMMDRPRYENEIIPEDIPLTIVYEDPYVMVVNKPAGLVVHPGHGNYHSTLVNALAWHMKDIPDYDANDPHVGLVHRIDKDTSGLLVIAKTPDAKTNLGLQFFNKTTKRRYRALVWGCLGEALLLYYVLKQKENGATIEEAAKWAEENKLHICHDVTVDDLNHLHRGGRVSKTSAVLGTMVQIKPIIIMDDNGCLKVVGKERGRKKSLNKIVDMAAKQAEGYENEIIMITHGDCPEDAEYVAKRVQEKMGIQNIYINNIGTVIGGHTGPGVVAVFCMGDKREVKL